MKRQKTHFLLYATLLTVAILGLWSIRRGTLRAPVAGGSAQLRPPSTHDAVNMEGETPASRDSQTHEPTNSPTRIPAPATLSLSRYPTVILDRDPDFGTPHFVRRRSGFLSTPAPGAPPEQIVSAVIHANARTFTLAPSDLQPPNARLHQDYPTKHNGARHLRWQQQKNGIDIYGATFALNRRFRVCGGILH